MRALKAIGVLWLLLIVGAAIVVGIASSASQPDSPTVGRVVGDLRQLDMLDTDQQMLNRMRTSIAPNMGTMIQNNPMWVDPDMIQVQEEYQAQLDRMIGKRPGRP